MINTTESKVKTVPKKEVQKQCLRCGKLKDLSQFNTNRQWEEQLGRDVWCKDCLSRCISKDQIREYFWQNNRQFTQDIWIAAEKKARRMAQNSATYNKASEDRQASMLQKLTAQQMPTVVQSKYIFKDNTYKGKIIPYQDAKTKGLIHVQKNKDQKQYSKDFNGWFKQVDLEYLQNYYQRLEQEFDLNNETLRDSARKAAKASLQVDKAMDDYYAGKCDYSVVKDAMAVFDTINKSANFAECKRKPGQTSGNTCWSDTTLYLMKNKKIIQNPIKWQQDDVDKVINLYLHTISAVGLDQA